jgi:hypothetical protein
MLASRQPHGEFGELADFAVDRDRSAMLLGYDIEADRQAKPGTFAGRLGGEERLEQLISVFTRNADTVVAHRISIASPTARVATFNTGRYAPSDARRRWLAA